jgi:hypothetical protein
MEVGYSENDEFENKTPKLTKVETFVVDNSNNKQVFKLTESINKCKTLRLLMKTFNDLYGRIIVYDLQIKGNTSI